MLNRLSDKLVTANGAQAFIPSLKGWEGQITPDLERLAETLVPRLKVSSAMYLWSVCMLILYLALGRKKYCERAAQSPNRKERS